MDSLPEPLRVETCARLDPAALGALDATPARGAADRIVYHIVVGEGGAAGPLRPAGDRAAAPRRST